MSLGTGDPASETGDDSLSAITFDSDFETKTKKKSSHKPPPPSPKSPYRCTPRAATSWRSLRPAASTRLGNRMSLTPQKLWPGSSKPGSVTQPPKSGLAWEHAWTHPPGSTPDSLTEALRVKRSALRRSASNGHVPATPVYREKEDMYDEIMDLKKSLHVQKSDADLLRTKLRRLEEENSRKDRQIEQLLDPSRGLDSVWTLGEKRPDTGWVVNGLKQRVLRLEQQCKDKDSTISKLQADLKTTSLEEMRVVMETYYEEIHRLQALLASSETSGKKPPAERKAGLRRQKRLSSTLLSLSRSVQELTEENQSLKEDLDRVLSSSPTVSRTKGYAEWSRPRLLRRIAELEKKVNSMESPKPQASEVAKSGPLAFSASGSWVHRPPSDGHREDSERLREAVRSLDGEREALQARLQERELEVAQLLQTKADLQKELEGTREGEEERRAREEALREEIQALTKKFQDLAATRKEEDPPEVTPEAWEEPRPSCPATASSPPQHGPEPEPEASEASRPQPPRSCSEEQRLTAARTLQARWKARRRQKRKAVLDEAATVLQAALRGHLARARLLVRGARGSGPPSVPGLPGLPNQASPPPCIPSSAVQAKGDPGQEAAVAIIQSVLRAHLARVRHRPRAVGLQGAAQVRQESHGQKLLSGRGETAQGSDLSLETAAPLPSPSASPPWEDVCSDDSDEVVVAPALPRKRTTAAPPAPGAAPSEEGWVQSTECH
ncbi:IQ domain-containing protein E [Molossus molossus]|uniref:IQ domain-containing protein E n=1 Tax=Molossus molossus TaxID=27622 RepID=UPI0017464BF1|nr:IQ domain-containing protein E [Molossus molossus]